MTSNVHSISSQHARNRASAETRRRLSNDGVCVYGAIVQLPLYEINRAQPRS